MFGKGKDHHGEFFQSEAKKSKKGKKKDKDKSGEDKKQSKRERRAAEFNAWSQSDAARKSFNDYKKAEAKAKSGTEKGKGKGRGFSIKEVLPFH